MNDVGRLDLIVLFVWLGTFRPALSACPAKFPPSHTACKRYNFNLPKRGVTEADKKIILNTHNKFRGNLKKYGLPPAAQIMKLYWDDEIAMVAQKHTDSCIWDHDKNWNRNIPGRFPVGQNLAKGHSSWKSAITDWFNEYKNFKYNKKRTGVIGHFTQVVWASTNRVGCGFSLCPIGRIWACNYAPAGNYAHMLLKPYPSGASQGVDCPKSLKHGVCDCGSSICIAGGTLNANTCKCKCPYNKPWIRPPECGVNCTLVTDKLSWICKTNNGPWGPKYCKYGNVKNEHCPVMCGICPGSDISRQVEGGAIVYDLQTPTTPAPTASTINPAPTTTPVAPTTPVPTKHPHQSDCSKPDDKICGLPSRKGSYHRKSCYKRKVYTRCPAMCRRCQARSCVDAHSKIRKIGETWIHINEFKVRCTKHGYHFIRGCRVSMGQKVIILFPGKTYGRCRCRKRPRGLVQWKCYRRLF